MTVQRIAVFPDTNLFLHFRPLSEINWREFLQSTSVEIKIAPVVTRELEERKTLSPSRKLRERAEAALKLLHGYLGRNDVRDGVTLEFLIKEPTIESATARGLNLQLGDDRLLGTLLLYCDAHPDIPCVLVTNDLPLTVKARQYQIQVAELTETLRLPSEPDPLETKNKQLEAELLRYKSREPDLQVLFDNGENHSQFQIARSTDSDSEATIQSQLAAAKEKCPLLEIKPQSASPITVNNPLAELAESMRKATEGIQAFGRQFCEGHNIRVREYYREYEQYLRDTVAFKTLETRTVELNLIVANGGTSPAEDIHVLLHFPDGVELYDEEHPPKEPKEPAIPSRELDLFPHVTLASSFPDIRLPVPRDPTLPRIRKTNSYTVTFEKQKLQHGFVWPLAPLYVVFNSWESANSFSISYAVHAGNMIDDETGELGVVINKS